MSIVTVFREPHPPYPTFVDLAWVEAEEYFALQQHGPHNYGLGYIETWLHERQKKIGDTVPAKDVFEQIMKEDLLSRTLSYADGLAIQALGGKVYLERFGEVMLPLWRSVVRDTVGRMLVPHLSSPIGGAVPIFWHWLELDLNHKSPTPLFLA